VQPLTPFRIPAPEAVKDGGGGYDLSGIARRFAPDFQQDARAIVVSKRQNPPSSEPEFNPDDLAVRLDDGCDDRVLIRETASSVKHSCPSS
jgi:hypothetical protein